MLSADLLLAIASDLSCCEAGTISNAKAGGVQILAFAASSSAFGRTLVEEWVGLPNHDSREDSAGADSAPAHAAASWTSEDHITYLCAYRSRRKSCMSVARPGSGDLSLVGACGLAVFKCARTEALGRVKAGMC